MSLFPAEPRTRQVAHYVISHVQPSQLGATKLNKVMWKADVLHYRRYGKSVTGQTAYVRMPQGPVPNHMKEAIEELKAEQVIVERRVETIKGARREFVPVHRMEASDFSATEVEVLHEAIDVVCKMSARAASDDTHDALWEEIENGGQMPIRAAAVILGELEPGDFQWALSQSAAAAG